MTPRERLLGVFRHQEVDRVPVSFFVQEEYLSEYYPKSRARRLEEAYALAEELDFDLMVREKRFERPWCFEKSAPNWKVERSLKRSDGICRIQTQISTPGGVLTQTEAGPDTGTSFGGLHLAVTEYLIKTDRDLELFLTYFPAFSEEEFSAMADYADRAQKLIGQRGILVPWSWAGVYNQAASLRDPQELLVDAYEEPERYEALMEFLTDKTIEYTLRLAQTAVDAVGLQGNMANGAMMGKTFFDEWILPYEARLVAAVHSCGRPVVYHNCGCARNLLPSYVEMELDAWETVAQAPQGDNDLRAAKEQVGEKLILIGNIDQVHFLKTASEAEVRERTAEIVQIGKTGGNYIFAASDFLEKGTPVENIRASIAAAKEAGKY